ncbi:glutathione peroxidase [Sporosarcina sp. FSL K6-2383]|uniref:glutathione peroxidase n=1 Tax=Sporosarcina sp. FSL K6-2383 TaxID=2921556 RepID=UPI00315B140E
MTIIYDFSLKKVNGQLQAMEEYRGKTLIIVNTASKCGFTSQFKELQELYEEYKERGLVILGFPSDNFNNQEFDDIEKTIEFCEINFGVTFPMFAKVDVKGEHAEPLFTFLTSEQKGLLTEGVKWNFTKFLIDREGNVLERIAPQTSPLKMRHSINQIV